ncbi:amidohydrolase family protein [Cetobacterium sp. 8H]|uniref:N-acyl-D-amino-acid deacylase family protein n=1 Tax=Cetobacterium sp. 8H TaxID=2759681 RepID=UPI00163B6D00|nr:amidohydrolase family protein [Cetobacterium sp. 8H]MBC2851864.1 amidohydrolase family protein [Cetobacterium sp. 8H]
MYDIVIENGIVVYGDLKPKEKMNLGISGDKISKISQSKLIGKTYIDAQGKFISPGFIDIHSHSDISSFIPYECCSKIYQGVTTEINGNCGIGIFPWEEYNLENLKKYIQSQSDLNYYDLELSKFKNLKMLKKEIENKMITNQGFLVGAGCIRIAIMGFEIREANELEIERMKNLLEEELKSGAYGLSFGLIYQPGNFMSKQEIIELLRVVKKYDKIACFHMRNEGQYIENSIKEVISYGEISGAKIHISHLKIMDKNLWGKSLEIIEILEKASQNGIKISFDQYPYIATCTNMMVLLPEELFTGNIEKFLESIDAIHKDIYIKIKENINRRGGEKNIIISNAYLDGLYDGKTLSEVSENLRLDSVETVLYLIKKSFGKVQAIYCSLDETDVFNFYGCELGIIASDGSSIPLTDECKLGSPHPRNFGTFPKYIRQMRELGKISIEKVINRITKKPAELLNIEKRGEIKVGHYADIVIFDYNIFKDNSTFKNPYLRATGVEYMLLNGNIIIDKGGFIKKNVGRVI